MKNIVSRNGLLLRYSERDTAVWRDTALLDVHPITQSRSNTKKGMSGISLKTEKLEKGIIFESVLEKA